MMITINHKKTIKFFKKVKNRWGVDNGTGTDKRSYCG